MALPRSTKPSQISSVPRARSSPVLTVLAVVLLSACAAGLGWAVWVTTQADAETPASAPVGQVVVEPGAQPSPEELAADYLAGRGHRVRLLRRDPQPDAQLDDDDFPTEIKTVENLTGSDTAAGLSRRIQEGMRQAPSVVVDARQQKNLTGAQIAEALRRAIGAAELLGRTIKRILMRAVEGATS